METALKEIVVQGGQFAIALKSKPVLNLEYLLAQITTSNIHEGIVWAEPVGKESC